MTKKAIKDLAKLVPTRTRPPGRSSISDNDRYPVFCWQAAFDDSKFATFRSNPIYRRIVETVTEEQGQQYLEYLRSKRMALGRFLELFASDNVGGPRLVEYPGIGWVSSTSLRYAKILVDVEEEVGELRGKEIAEIGVGFGGLCRLALRAGLAEHYTLIDLSGPLALANRYLRESGCDMERISLLPPEHLDDMAPDVVISTYAYSELTRDVQEAYFARVVQNAGNGFFLYNHISPPEFRSLTAMEFADRIPSARLFREQPLTHPLNVGVCW